jgi:hypothetical protein
MDDDDMDKIADAIATLVAQTNAQVAAVLTATRDRLVGRDLLTPADLAEIVSAPMRVFCVGRTPYHRVAAHQPAGGAAAGGAEAPPALAPETACRQEAGAGFFALRYVRWGGHRIHQREPHAFVAQISLPQALAAPSRPPGRRGEPLPRRRGDRPRLRRSRRLRRDRQPGASDERRCEAAELADRFGRDRAGRRTGSGRPMTVRGAFEAAGCSAGARKFRTP